MQNPERFVAILSSVLIVSTVLFVCFGIVGFLAWGHAVQQNLLITLGKEPM